jgi:hypothetical protein
MLHYSRPSSWVMWLLGSRMFKGSQTPLVWRQSGDGGASVTVLRFVTSDCWATYANVWFD